MGHDVVPKEIGTLFEDESGQFYETRFDASRFAKWVSSGYENSSYKSIKALAEDVNSNPATISRLMNAAPQWTGKPSKPKFSLVTALSEKLNIDIAEGMAAAGYSYLELEQKKPQNIVEFLEVLENLGIEEFQRLGGYKDIEEFTEDEYAELLEQIAASVEIKLKRKQKK